MRALYENRSVSVKPPFKPPFGGIGGERPPESARQAAQLVLKWCIEAEGTKPRTVTGKSAGDLADAKAVGGVDDDAFRPASEFVKGPFDTFAKVRKVLKQNTWIRTQKPNKQRLKIHAGDWQKFLNVGPASVDPLDLPAEMVDKAVKEVADRTAKERTNRSKK